METYLDVYVSSDGELTSQVYDKILNLGLKPAIGKHDFVWEWEGIVSMKDVIDFADKIQKELSGTGALLKFTSDR